MIILFSHTRNNNNDIYNHNSYNNINSNNINDDNTEFGQNKKINRRAEGTAEN